MNLAIGSSQYIEGPLEHSIYSQLKTLHSDICPFHTRLRLNFPRITDNFISIQQYTTRDLPLLSGGGGERNVSCSTSLSWTDLSRYMCTNLSGIITSFTVSTTARPTTVSIASIP